MQRYVPRLVPAGTSPKDALVERTAVVGARQIAALAQSATQR